VGLVLGGLPLVWRTLQGLRRGVFAADIVAALAIVTAFLLGQPVAGLVIVLMQTGGEALEQYAADRASRAVEELEAAAPRTAHRMTAGEPEEIEVDQIRVGDRLWIRPGEMVPCDGTVVSGRSHADTARLTGEPIPISIGPGSRIRSGTLNLESPFALEATAVASESLYARIVELVRSAEASKAPLQRLADRYAVWFTPITLALCLAAYLASHDPLRVLAVLVVATPCPLILATPIAIIGGINQAARRQIIVRHGGALEQLGSVDTVVFDKTGTITFGRPAVASVTARPPFDEATVLQSAGAVEQGSGHLLGRSVREAALARYGALPAATEVTEAAGRGVRGIVQGQPVVVGSLGLLHEWAPDAAAVATTSTTEAGLRTYVAIGGVLAGIITYADQLRPKIPAAIQQLRRLGIGRLLLLSGDHGSTVAAIAGQAGIEEAAGDLLPQDKLTIVDRLAGEGRRVLMIGDGVNDAPALRRAAVGMALANGGGGIAVEAADIVLLVDDVTRVPEAIGMARRTLRIARQSIGVGLGLSSVAMIVAAAGFIPPTAGAVLQEVIDVAVILNALRAARPATKNT
jgi:heavy metal translocating P-type ATPase